jgi:FkbM family methyltransferase
MDLRDWNAQHWLMGSPWSASPREIVEQAIFGRFVKEGDVVYDVGANVGLHTVLLSKLVGRSGHVYAFEPNPRLLPGLRSTIASVDNITLFAVALSQTTGEITLFVPEEDHSRSSLSNWTRAGRFHVEPVACEQVPLDRLRAAEHIPPPAFIKCDVEGAELDVFQGAANTLNIVQAPWILFEANIDAVRGFDRELSAAKDFLEGLEKPRYCFFYVDETGNITTMDVLDKGHANILAVPHIDAGGLPEAIPIPDVSA